MELRNVGHQADAFHQAFQLRHRRIALHRRAGGEQQGLFSHTFCHKQASFKSGCFYFSLLSRKYPQKKNRKGDPCGSFWKGRSSDLPRHFFNLSRIVLGSQVIALPALNDNESLISCFSFFCCSRLLPSMTITNSPRGSFSL